MLEAFDLVRQEYPDVELLIIGDGEQRSAVERHISQNGMQDSVKLLGAVPNNQVQRALAESSVFVQASLTTPDGAVEGWGVSLAEALATGLPAVVSKSGGMMDLVEDGVNGYLFPEGDSRAMSEKMKILAAAPDLRRRLGAAGRRHVQKMGDTEKLVVQLESVVRSVARTSS
jgi:glycosyltransferase involved in cell wall biosynthesis